MAEDFNYLFGLLVEVAVKKVFETCFDQINRKKKGVNCPLILGSVWLDEWKNKMIEKI